MAAVDTTGLADATARIQTALEGVPHRWIVPKDEMPAVEVEREHAAEVLARLKAEGRFESVTFVTAVDHYPSEPRFVVSWQLLSVMHGDRVRVSLALAEDESVPTCTHLWPGAAYSERECYDMFGIRFDGHAGLKRLLMPDGYGHHPLRKDFPHQGIQPDRLYREWDAARRRRWQEQER